MAHPRILVSAGEASGDFYAARLVEALRRRFPSAGFYGCAGPRMRESGVRPVVDAASLSVVGLVEVLVHIPRIYGEYRRLLGAARRDRPHLAVLTDSPDFHLPLARRLHRLGVPVIYLIAPQAWAWRKSRVRTLRRNITSLLCIFPFEQEFFQRHGVPAAYIGHPLTRIIRPSLSRDEFAGKHRLPPDRPVITLLPGSRPGEITRHLPVLREAVDILRSRLAATFLLGAPAPGVRPHPAKLWEPIRSSPIQLIEGETWDAIAHSDLALAASGTVAVEAALLGTPLVAFYKVTGLSWWLGRFLVDVPFYSMVNLVAGRQVVPELIQDDLTARRLAQEAHRLLADSAARSRMKEDLLEVRARLSAGEDPMEKAAEMIQQFLSKEGSDVP